ncbi:MAG TPA: hypothetical protein VFY71_07775 [Planctomycetota bacterium]|nr:hypothetical protein [Planctomycetota bacterium]
MSTSRPAGRGADHHPTQFVRRLVLELLHDPRVDAFWLEGEDESIQWPPYARLDLHFSVPEPYLQAVRGEFLATLRRADAVTDFSQQDAPLQGFAGSAKLSDGTPLTYRLERSSQIAKVPRRAVNVLLDRSGGLLVPALSFEKR